MKHIPRYLTHDTRTYLNHPTSKLDIQSDLEASLQLSPATSITTQSYAWPTSWNRYRAARCVASLETYWSCIDLNIIGDHPDAQTPTVVDIVYN